MEIIQNFISEILFYLFRQWKGIFGAVDKTVNLPSIGATDAQIAEISRCITRIAMIIGTVVVVLKSDAPKLGILILFMLFAGMIYVVLKD